MLVVERRWRSTDSNPRNVLRESDAAGPSNDAELWLWLRISEAGTCSFRTSLACRRTFAHGAIADIP
jgi:hypothetical protein